MSRFAVSTDKIGLYSPPQSNRRLPKKEPRPQQGKSIPIAAGFRCRDGVLLLADSQHSAGDNRYTGPKLWNMYYNFARIDETLRCTPAMEAGVSDYLWSIQEIVGLADRDK